MAARARRSPPPRSRWSRRPSSRRSRSTACAVSTEPSAGDAGPRRPLVRRARRSTRAALPVQPERGAASRAVRGAGLPLRHAAAVVPEDPAAGRRSCPGWSEHPDVHRRARGGGRRRRRSGPPTCAPWPAWPRTEPSRSADGSGREAGRPLPVRPELPDLPDLGAHLRLQPGVRALPVVVGPPRPARADHRRGQGAWSTSCSGCRSSTSTSAAASRRCGRTSGSCSTTRSATTSGSSSPPTGSSSTSSGPRSWPRTDYVDVQISLDGATAEVNDHVRGPGSYDTAMRALENLAEAGFAQPKISVVMTRQNVDQLDEFKAIADKFGAQLRITRLRPSGRGADVWDELHPTAAAAAPALRLAGRARRGRADRRLVLPPVGLRRGAAGAEPVRRGAGGVPDRPGRRRVRVPVRDPRELPGRQRALAGRVRRRSGGTRSCSPSCAGRRPAAPARSCAHYDSCQGGCMAAKFFTGLPLDGPDPECVRGFGEQALAARDGDRAAPDAPRSTTPGRRRGTPGAAGPGTDLDRHATGRRRTPDRGPPGQGV